MSLYTVVITDHDFDELDIEAATLENIAELRDLSGLTGPEFEEALTDANGVLNLRRNLNDTLITRMDQCEIIARYGIGIDNIDISTAAEQNIYITNVPDYCIEEVAVHALSLILAIARGITAYDQSVANGEWNRGVATPLHRFSTQTIGIVGFGDIGQELACRLEKFNIKILVSDPYLEPEDIDNESASLVPFETLLTNADYVSVHSPLTDETRGMFDAEVFDIMKDAASLINVSRGSIVDESALLEALESGALRAAGLDVFNPEPPASDSRIRDHPNVITTPHVAWYSEEANDQRRHTAAKCVRDALTGSTPENVVADPFDSG